jgi:hypothetical protein
MPVSPFLFFLIWLLAALAAAVVLYVVWQRLYVKYVANSSVRPGGTVPARRCIADVEQPRIP